MERIGINEDMAAAYEAFVERRFVKRSQGDEGLMHAAIGVAGEAGELLDAVKKVWVYSGTLDRTNVVEEMGDLEFYLQAARKRLGITREEVIAANVEKLTKRYPDGYTDELAKLRLDKIST